MFDQCVKSWQQYTKNPEVVQINNRYGYISIVYFDENLTKLEALVIYGIRTRDCPEGI